MAFAGLAWLLSAGFVEGQLLGADKLRAYVEHFNAADSHHGGHIPNAQALDFLERNIPLFECPDADFERTYFFRWWTYRKHCRRTPEGWVVTEFLPDVSWAGKYNAISCPLGHHFYEGRWLKDRAILDDYARFWLGGGGNPRSYSNWLADAIHARSLVTGDHALELELLPRLVANDEAWEAGQKRFASRLGGQEDGGLFYSIDDRDGGEVSVSGSGFRPTLNSYQYGDARAIAAIAKRAGDMELVARYEAKAARLKRLVQEKLWDPEAKFFKVLSPEVGKRVDVREWHGYLPWYFGLADAGHDEAWKQLMDVDGFAAPYGPCVTERRHPGFRLSYEGHECQWNGPSWPFATSAVLTAMANVLQDGKSAAVSRRDYFDVLGIYTRSQRLKKDDGSEVPWIDENLNPLTGDWIARTRLKTWKDGNWDPSKGGVERGKDYNHSTYNDLIITGLLGLRPRGDDVVEVNPLLPPEVWDFFCLDRVPYHGRVLGLLWDRDGKRYGKGVGFSLWVDGVKVASSPELGRLQCALPPRQGETKGRELE